MQFPTRTGAPVLTTVTPVESEGVVVAALVQTASARSSSPSSWSYAIGWDGLTETERVVTELAAEASRPGDRDAAVPVAPHRGLAPPEGLPQAGRELAGALATAVANRTSVSPTARDVQAASAS